MGPVPCQGSQAVQLAAPSLRPLFLFPAAPAQLFWGTSPGDSPAPRPQAVPGLGPSEPHLPQRWVQGFNPAAPGAVADSPAPKPRPALPIWQGGARGSGDHQGELLVSNPAPALAAATALWSQCLPEPLRSCPQPCRLPRFSQSTCRAEGCSADMVQGRGHRTPKSSDAVLVLAWFRRSP